MELAISISLHVSFSPDFPGVKRNCYVRSVIATVPAVPADAVSGTTWRESQGCGLGVAEPATIASTPGQLPSGMSGMCTAGCAATWTCSAFRASMVWDCSPWCIDCFECPLIGVLRAGIASSHFRSTAALYRRNSLWSQGWSLIPSRTSIVFNSITHEKPKVDFRHVKRMIAKGDGVRLITAVLLAGQMMTPDKFLVAESCPRQ
jgi:hypothetical protein